MLQSEKQTAAATNCVQDLDITRCSTVLFFRTEMEENRYIIKKPPQG